MIIFRYLCRQVYGTLSGVTGILLLIFLGNALIHYLTRAAAGKLNTAVIIKLVAIQIPFLLGVLLPMGLFVTFMLVYGRMYAESEMTVLQAGGFSPKQLLQYSLAITFFVLIVNVILVFFVSPRLMDYGATLIAQGKQGSFFALLQPGRFQISDDSNSVYYVEDVNKAGTKVTNVFIAEHNKNKTNPTQDQWTITAAATGTVATTKNHDSYFVTEHGYRYDGVPGQANYRVIAFGQAARRINAGPITGTPDSGGLSTRTLWQTRKQDPAAMAELQWRVSIPLSTLIFTLLVIPLSRVNPRQGRYSRLLPAALLYAIYVNLMFVARNAIQNGSLPPWIGMWWLPIALSLFTLMFWYLPAWRVRLADANQRRKQSL